MFATRHTQHRRVHGRRAAAVTAVSVAALASLAALPASGLATDTIKVGVGGASIIVDGTTISTSNLTLAQLAKLQGVPTTTVAAELDGVAANTPVASAVEALINGLPVETSLATALNELSAATGGAISPQAALEEVIGDNGQPGTAGNGSNGGSGAPGTNGAPGANGSAPAGVPSKTAFTLRASKSLKGHPGSRVRVTLIASSAAKLSYSGSKLAKGSRKIGSGNTVLMVKLPKKHGNYKLSLKAVSAATGQSAQTTVALHDVKKAAKKAHR
jgi:hypothetical protein